MNNQINNGTSFKNDINLIDHTISPNYNSKNISNFVFAPNPYFENDDLSRYQPVKEIYGSSFKVLDRAEEDEHSAHSDIKKNVSDKSACTRMLISFLMKENVVENTNLRNKKIERILNMKISGINEQTLNHLFEYASQIVLQASFEPVAYTDDDIRKLLLADRPIKPQNNLEQAVYNLTLEHPTYKYGKLTTRICRDHNQINKANTLKLIRKIQTSLFKKILPQNVLPQYFLSDEQRCQEIQTISNHLMFSQIKNEPPKNTILDNTSYIIVNNFSYSSYTFPSLPIVIPPEVRDVSTHQPNLSNCPFPDDFLNIDLMEPQLAELFLSLESFEYYKCEPNNEHLQEDKLTELSSFANREQNELNRIRNKTLAYFLFHEKLDKDPKARKKRITEILGTEINRLNNLALSNALRIPLSMIKKHNKNIEYTKYNIDLIRKLLFLDRINPKDIVEQAVYNLSIEPPTLTYLKLTNIIISRNDNIPHSWATKKIRKLQISLFKRVINQNNSPKTPLPENLRDKSIQILTDYLINLQKKSYKKRSIEVLNQDNSVIDKPKKKMAEI